MHGLRLVAVASDFLCQKCEQAFPLLNIIAVTVDELVEWCARLRLSCEAPASKDLLQGLLLREQGRMKRRALAMSLAQDARRGSINEKGLFGEFCSQMDMGHFESTTVCRDVFSSCHGAVPADVYRMA